MSHTLEYVVANGIATYLTYPYTGIEGPCKTFKVAYKISSYVYIINNNC